MHKMDRFLISNRPYAVDFESFGKQHVPAEGIRREFWRCTIDAVWFRRRSGITAACIGYLWETERREPKNGLGWIEGFTDGRYGGTALGRWDGESYWGDGTLADQDQHLKVLRPMLANYPEIPAGFDGWWRF